MTDIRVHLYALCWNEARMLPFFFRHYDAIVDRYFIFDNGSIDGSLEILGSHRKVTLEHFTVEGPSFVFAAQKFYNQCWKASRSQADWAIVCNIDEHLYHRDLREYLRECRRNNYTLIIPEGYQMISEEFPSGDQPLYLQVRTAARFRTWTSPSCSCPTISSKSTLPRAATARSRRETFGVLPIPK